MLDLVSSIQHLFILPISIPPVENWWMETTAKGGQAKLENGNATKFIFWFFTYK